jgi:hypothetical protein
MITEQPMGPATMLALGAAGSIGRTVKMER